LTYFNEKARKHAIISQTEHFSPGRCRYPKMQKNTAAFVQLTKDDLWLLTKKKKRFYDFYVRCHIKTEESANRPEGCGAKLQGL